MPRKPISFELDFMVKDIFPRFTVKQFDDVSFNIKPKNQGLDYDTTGMTGKIFVGINNDMFMQTTGITVSSDNINVLLDKNMLQKNGRAYAEIELTDDAGTITSSSFIFDIDPKIGEGGQIPGEYEGFVEKYERLISEFKSQVNSCTNNANNLINKTINNCNSSVNNKLNTVDGLINSKISDFEKRFNRLTSSQQQSAEIIDARQDFKGNIYNSLKERIDATDKILRDSTVSTVETESNFTTVDATSNGYFEDTKLEGKTLVNLFDTNHYNLTTSDSTAFKKNTLLHNRLGMLVTGKEYTLIYKFSSDQISGYFGVVYKTSDANQRILDSVNIGGTFPTNGIVKFNLTANDPENVVLYTRQSSAVVDYDLNVILLEGDHTNNPPEYFEGLMSAGQDVEEVSVASVNKLGYRKNIAIAVTSPYGIANNGVSYILEDIKIGNLVVNNFKNSERMIVATYDSLEVGTPAIERFDLPKTIGKQIVKINQKAKFAVLYLSPSYDETTNGYIYQEQDKKRLLYYNNETQTWEKPILREWDSIEKHSDGKYYYHKRSGEVVLNGSEDWKFSTNLSSDTHKWFFVANTDLAQYTSVICDRFKYKNDRHGREEEFIYTDTDINIIIDVTKLSSSYYLSSFKDWLQANPTTVVYQLAQEKIYECTNIDLITYEGETNYIVSSGAITPKSTLKVHNNISNVVKILQEKVSLLESNVKASQEIQDMMILESDMRILDIELVLMEHMPITLNLGGSDMLRSATYFNFLKNHIINETYKKEYLENVMNKYLATGRINQDEYEELYKMLYPPVYDIELPIEYK